MLERMVIAGLAGAASGVVTLLLGGSYTLALILAGVAGLLSALFRDLFLLFGWDD